MVYNEKEFVAFSDYVTIHEAGGPQIYNRIWRIKFNIIQVIDFHNVFISIKAKLFLLIDLSVEKRRTDIEKCRGWQENQYLKISALPSLGELEFLFKIE